jgi:enterochelin esterase family protein
MSQDNSRNDKTRKAGEYSLGPDSFYHEGVPRGTVTKYEWSDNKVYPGTSRDYWIYVPAQYDPSRPACIMVFQDGDGFVETEKDGSVRVPIVFDNLIHQHQMPVTIGLFINAARESEAYLADACPEKYPESRRAEEYDVVSDRYANFLIEEMLPTVGRKYSLTGNPEGRAICGSSSGGLCAWTVAWYRPDAFRKVVSFIGSFTGINGGYIYPYLIRKSEKKPIRVFLQANSRDLDNVWGDWYLANKTMASALRFKGYDYRFELGDGYHDLKQGTAIMPEVLRWLWRDYSVRNEI